MKTGQHRKKKYSRAHEYWINNKYYQGWFSLNDILAFKECILKNRQSLKDRIKYSETVTFLSFWDSFTTKLDVRIKMKGKLSHRLNMFECPWAIGSMYKQALVMQSRRIT